LGQCRSLTQLSLPEAQLDDEGLSKLRGLRLLAGLDISRTQVHGMAFDGIESFSGLRQLSAEGTPIDDDGAFLVGRLPQLRSLNLSHAKVTDVACEYLSRHDLVTLNLANNNITDRGINSLHCERLAKLNLYETAVSARAFAAASQWPSLELLILGTPTDSEDDLERVLQMPMLKKLYANGEFSPEFHLRYSKRLARGWTKEWTE
jgi:Leucine-rich repeat (LRR) protein